MSDRIDSMLDFLVLADRFKTVERRAYIEDGSRRENSAEHSWHMALCAILLETEIGFPVDLGRTLSMVLVHDLVEIYAGDAFAYDAAAREAAVAKEEAAARKLFGSLPADLGAKLEALWREFEAHETPEARLAYACDRLQGFLQVYISDGKSWAEARVTREMTRKRTAPAREADPAIERLVERIYERIERRGFWNADGVAVGGGKGVVP
ncbi:MAG: HD domain-containing protein [Rhodospirillales bacterium]|nr:HD domain-containing protein [Rhodospirillales bacterium]